jgi:signal transduction histidine kinase
MNRRHHESMHLPFPTGHEGEAGQLGHVYFDDGKTLMTKEDMPSYRAVQGEEFDDYSYWVGADPRSRKAFSTSARQVRGPAGQKLGAALAYQDITDLMRAMQVKDEFVSSVSHELRTPLTSIYGFAETLLRQDVLFGDDERQTFLGYIASESERLTGIVDQLLNVARLDTGDLQVNLAPTDVRGIVSDVVRSTELLAAANGHRFVLDLPEDPLDAEADAEKLRQIVANLVDNAVKFSPAGGTVTLAARRAAERVEVRVIDEGIGIPEEEQRRIFTRFYRGESIGRRPGIGGTGLGLFIAHGLVSAMGGRMWVDSSEGAGSSFAFELPAAQSAAVAGE